MPGPRTTLLLALGLAPIAVGPMMPTPAVAQGRSLAEVRDQGVLYCKRKRFRQALASLSRAYAMKGGPGDFPTVYYRGVAAFELGLIELAFEMSEVAERLAVDDGRKRRVTRLRDQIRRLYGPVTVKPSPNESNRRGRIFFEAKTGIINPEKKKRFAALQTRYQETSVTLPATVFLPYGEYTANNVPFAVVEGAQKPPTVEVFLQVAEDDGGGGMTMGLDGETWMWIGIGVGAAVGIGVGAALLLSGDDEPVEAPDGIIIRGE